MKLANATEGIPYNYQCVHCDGSVGSKKIDREVFKHKQGFIILEEIEVGVCNSCRARYYSAEILHAVNDLATGATPFERMEQIPVAHLP